MAPTGEVARKESRWRIALRYFLAGMLTVLAHSAFMFFTEHSDLSEKRSEDARYVAMLPVGTENPSLEERNLLAWMKIMDSMIMVTPNRRHGFSISIPLAVPPDEKLMISPYPAADASGGSFVPLPELPESERDKIARLWQFEPAGVPAPPLREKTEPAVFPLWLTAKGQILPQIFRNPGQMRAMVTQRKDHEIADTVLRWRKSESAMFPRITVEFSSGDNDLDRLAARTLSFEWATFSEAADIPAAATEGLTTVRWQ
ncbi:MAG: hypothetical protein JW808_05055 [Victivallales bacterium]|nr:hypothetical protein [Victivallales bacterium]